MHTGEFGDIFKVLTISHLNFIDTDLIPKTGSFASPEGPNGNVSKFFQWFKAYFSFWLESSGGGDFVNIILHVRALAELTIPVSIQTEGEMIERGYAVTRYCCHYHMYQSGEHE